MTVDFKSCQNLGELPVDQRLRFVFGQVLGEKEFRQEQVYFINKNRVHNRGLHGYGTVWGLGLSTDGTGDDLEVRVAPGLAVDPCGQEIEIGALQCAQLNAWLLADAVGADGQPVLDGAGNPRRNGATLQPRGEGPAPVAVYVTLAYSECLTGEQPVFGEPCRSDSEAIQATRIKDDFRLNLTATPPHVEEQLVRAFGGLLGQVRLGPEGPPPSRAEVDALEEVLRDAVDALPSLPAAPIVLPPSAARELLREAFRHWAVTKRPPPPPANDAVVLLGAIELTLTAAGRADEAAGLTVDDSGRPYLLHTRLLQEILMSGGKGEKGDPGDPGQDGADGRDGVDGQDGRDGADGQNGRDGVDGQNGRDGTNGTNGTNGQDGAPGPGLNQVFINANMMFGGQRPATLGLIAPASPAWTFGQAGLAVVFTWGRPSTMERGERVALRLYWTTNIRLNTEARGTWHVGARWVRARRPGEAASNDAILEAALPDAAPATQPIQVRGTAQRQLQVTDLFTLPPEPQAGAHFLMVEVALAEWQPGDEVATASLLLAQLDWEA